MVYVFYLQSRSPREQHKRDKPQEYMSSFKVTNYTVHGNAKESLVADYWEFIPHKGCSDLINPQLVVYEENGDVWNLIAAKAIAWHPAVTAKIDKIDLFDGVKMRRLPLNNAVPLVVESIAVQYLPEKEVVTSTEFVSMQQPGLTINGYGMIGDLDRGWIKLHERVTTVYTPKAN